MSRATSITCDNCKEPVVHGYAVQEVHREAYVSWGDPESSDFCSAACIVAHFDPETRARRGGIRFVDLGGRVPSPSTTGGPQVSDTEQNEQDKPQVETEVETPGGTTVKEQPAGEQPSEGGEQERGEGHT